MLDGQLNGPVGLGFAGATEDLDHIIVAEFRQMKVFNFVGLG